MAGKPVRTADTEIIIDETNGETIREIEHFRQGERFYRIVHENGDTVVEDEEMHR